MKWILSAAVIAIAAAVLLTNRPEEEAPPATSKAPPEKASVPREKGTPEPRLTASAPTDQAAPDVPDTPEAGAKGATAEDAPPAKAKVPRTWKPAGRTLGPGESFTPLSELKIPTPEERKATAEKTRKRLSAVRPLRSSWNDVPLQDILRQLSKESGMVIALGVRALRRGMEIRVTGPQLTERGADISVWSILQALARDYEFVLTPWKKGVLLNAKRDGTEMQFRVYDVRDVTEHAWGSLKETEKEDRLGPALPDMLRIAARFETSTEKRTSIKIRGTNLMAKLSLDVHDRIGEVLDLWRAEPKRLRAAYDALIAKRHPTVSGAPPREDSKAGGKR